MFVVVFNKLVIINLTVNKFNYKNLSLNDLFLELYIRKIFWAADWLTAPGRAVSGLTLEKITSLYQALIVPVF